MKRSIFGRNGRRFALALTIVASMLVLASFASIQSNDADEVHISMAPENSGTPDIRWYTDAIAADSEETRFTISTGDELAGLIYIVNNMTWPNIQEALDDFAGKTITLADDVDVSAYGASFNGGKGWISIGNHELWPFRGTFDGNGKEIAGLYINDTSAAGSLKGLFGCLDGGTIRDLGVVGADILIRRVRGDVDIHQFLQVGGGLYGAHLL